MSTTSRQNLPEWEAVLSAAARLQQLIPDAVLVGGTAAAAHAAHRQSEDADHVITDLRTRFDRILAELESVAGWKTARVNRPVQILGSLDGIETGVRQLIREKPLEVTTIDCKGQQIRIPTSAEILRIKSALILKRNATRDYLDFVALWDLRGDSDALDALRDLDELYPQASGESALQQLVIQLSNPVPYDLEETRLWEYKNLQPRWHEWSAVTEVCRRAGALLFDSAAGT